MSKFTEFLATSLAPVFAALGTEELTKVFAKVHEKDPIGHEATLKSLYIGVKQLERVTDNTKTKIDNVFVDALIAAIEASAEEFDVSLDTD
jgi:hypothetical protein